MAAVAMPKCSAGRHISKPLSQKLQANDTFTLNVTLHVLLCLFLYSTLPNNTAQSVNMIKV